MDNHAFWMIVSGVTGASCFVIIHFTKLLKNPTAVAVLQLASNTFVFISWGSSFLAADGGFFKAFCLIGTLFPFGTGSYTIWKVFVKRWRKRKQCSAD